MWHVYIEGQERTGLLTLCYLPDSNAGDFAVVFGPRMILWRFGCSVWSQNDSQKNIFHGPARTRYFRPHKSWTSIKISLVTLCGERVLLLSNVPVLSQTIPLDELMIYGRNSIIYHHKLNAVYVEEPMQTIA